jgi:hypothetical protein
VRFIFVLFFFVFDTLAASGKFLCDGGQLNAVAVTGFEGPQLIQQLRS